MSEPRSVSEDQRAYALGNESIGIVPAYTRPNGEFEWPSPGLTKRELFAFGAMQAILTGAVTRGCPAHEWIDQQMAVKCANALLKELAK